MTERRVETAGSVTDENPLTMTLRGASKDEKEVDR
jgi:hypothetical protein